MLESGSSTRCDAAVAVGKKSDKGIEALGNLERAIGWDQMVQHSTVRVGDYAIQAFAMYTCLRMMSKSKIKGAGIECPTSKRIKTRMIFWIRS